MTFEKADALREHLREHGMREGSEAFGLLSDAFAELDDALRERISRRISSIDHPCHDVCIGNVHADCQCAAWVRQEALTAASD